MRRKSTRNTKKTSSPEKEKPETPKTRRTSRRRKKSPSSESDDNNVGDNSNVGEQSLITTPDTTTKSHTPSDDESTKQELMWKVTPSDDGSAAKGELQKLKICLRRPSPGDGEIAAATTTTTSATASPTKTTPTTRRNKPIINYNEDDDDSILLLQQQEYDDKVNVITTTTRRTTRSYGPSPIKSMNDDLSIQQEHNKQDISEDLEETKGKGKSKGKHKTKIEKHPLNTIINEQIEIKSNENVLQVTPQSPTINKPVDNDADNLQNKCVDDEEVIEKDNLTTTTTLTTTTPTSKEIVDDEIIKENVDKNDCKIDENIELKDSEIVCVDSDNNKLESTNSCNINNKLDANTTESKNDKEIVKNSEEKEQEIVEGKNTSEKVCKINEEKIDNLSDKMEVDCDNKIVDEKITLGNVEEKLNKVDDISSDKKLITDEINLERKESNDEEQVGTTHSVEQEVETPPIEEKTVETLPIEREVETPPSEKEEVETPPPDKEEIETPPPEKEEIVTPPSEREVETPPIIEKTVQTSPPIEKDQKSTDSEDEDDEKLINFKRKTSEIKETIETNTNENDDESNKISKEDKLNESNVHDNNNGIIVKQTEVSRKKLKRETIKQLESESNNENENKLKSKKIEKRKLWKCSTDIKQNLNKIDLNTIKIIYPNIEFPQENELNLELSTTYQQQKQRKLSTTSDTGTSAGSSSATITKKINERKVSVDYQTTSTSGGSNNSSNENIETENVQQQQQQYEKQLSITSTNTNDDNDNNSSNIIAFNRKISIVDDSASKLRPPPSPARNPSSEVLYITNLVRPFTIKQLKELLERMGKIKDDGFWTDRIKSKCYVCYESVEEAEATRNALHGVHWPVGNGKKLIIEYATIEDLEKAKNPPASPTLTETVKNFEKENMDLNDKLVQQQQQQQHTQQEHQKEDSRKFREEPAASLPSSRKIQESTTIREWDLGKKEFREGRENRSRSRERSNRKHRRSPSPHEDFITRKQRKMEENVPQKLMDDLFSKTKATPSIYWLPLSPEEISTKQQQRLIRMEEHKRRMEENSRVLGRDAGRGAAYRRRYD